MTPKSINSTSPRIGILLFSFPSDRKCKGRKRIATKGKDDQKKPLRLFVYK